MVGGFTLLKKVVKRALKNRELDKNFETLQGNNI